MAFRARMADYGMGQYMQRPSPNIGSFEMKYTVIWADTLAILKQKVNVYLSEGWRLQGGITLTKNGNFVQAATKEGEE